MTANELLLSISDMLDKRLSPIENQLHRIEIDLLENNDLPRWNTITSCYTDIYNRYKDDLDKMELIFDNTEILKKVVTEHSETLQKIL